jgi:hypothetical protein
VTLFEPDEVNDASAPPLGNNEMTAISEPKGEMSDARTGIQVMRLKLLGVTLPTGLEVESEIAAARTQLLRGHVIVILASVEIDREMVQSTSAAFSKDK